MNAGIITNVLLPLALAIIMFGLGLSLRISDFKRIFVYPKAMLIGSFTQLILLPCLGFLIAALWLPSSPELAVGLIVLAMCPGGSTSNLLTHLANGDTALCISLTAISSIVKIFTIPVMVNVAIIHYLGPGSQLHLEALDSIMKIVSITIVPAVLGMLVKAWMPRFADRSQKTVKILSALFLVLVIFGAVFQEKDTILQSLKVAGPAAFVLNLSGMLLGYYIPKLFRLPVRQQITISIESSIQNGTLAIAIASSPLMLGNATMAIPAAVYSLIMFITAGVFVSMVNRRRTKLALA